MSATTTAEAIVTLLQTTLEAATVTGSPRFARHMGTLEDLLQAPDRSFLVLLQMGPEQTVPHTADGSKMTIIVQLAVAYDASAGAHDRAVADARVVREAIRTLRSAQDAIHQLRQTGPDYQYDLEANSMVVFREVEIQFKETA